MTHRNLISTVGSACLAALALPGIGQQSPPPRSQPPQACLNGAEAGSQAPAKYRPIRTIDDIGTHQRWLLLEDQSRPGAPFLLVQSSRDFTCGWLRLENSELRTTSSIQTSASPLIHAGDALVVSEHTPVSEVMLEATALKQAAVGEALPVKLKFGGRTRQAIAIGPGRAILVGESVAWR